MHKTVNTLHKSTSAFFFKYHSLRIPFAHYNFCAEQKTPQTFSFLPLFNQNNCTFYPDSLLHSGSKQYFTTAATTKNPHKDRFALSAS